MLIGTLNLTAYTIFFNSSLANPSFFKIPIIFEVAKRKHERTYRGKILTF